MRSIRAGCSVAALALAGVTMADLSTARMAGADPAGWTEVKWPFLLDQWGTGHAFACEGAGCLPQDRLLVREKSGFCNCTNGIADDDEVDRLTDFEFLDGRATPQGAGRPITIDGVSGRLRAFAVETARGGMRHAVAVVVARNCDAVVATIMSDAVLFGGQDSALLASVGPKMIAALP
jgi:hypothetical protein